MRGVSGEFRIASGQQCVVGFSCNSGYTGPDGGSCTSCVAGKFKATSGSALCTACEAKDQRRADIPRVWEPHQTYVNSAIQAAKLVSIRVVAVQAQGSWSARTAPQTREVIAMPDLPTGAQQQGSHAQWDIFVSVVLRTRRCVM